MKGKISSKNLYKSVKKVKFPGAKAYLVEKVMEKNSSYHLDFGSNYGELIGSLKKHELILKGVGFDANSSVVEKYNSEMPNGVELATLKKIHLFLLKIQFLAV